MLRGFCSETNKLMITNVYSAGVRLLFNRQFMRFFLDAELEGKSFRVKFPERGAVRDTAGCTVFLLPG
jgi:hypothetical protein